MGMVERATALDVLVASIFIASVVVLSVGVVCMRMNDLWGLLCGNLMAVTAGALMVVSAIVALRRLREGLETVTKDNNEKQPQKDTEESGD
jgi:membrane protein implicated in regulation of membrane protease activity